VKVVTHLFVELPDEQRQDMGVILKVPGLNILDNYIFTIYTSVKRTS